MRAHNSKKAAAAQAREGKARKHLRLDALIISSSESEEDDEITSWTGSVNNHLIMPDSDTDDPDASNISGELDDDEVLELEGVELIHSLENPTEHNEQMMMDMELPVESCLVELMKKEITTKDWKKAESNQGFGYTGNSDRLERRHRKDA